MSTRKILTREESKARNDRVLDALKAAVNEFERIEVVYCDGLCFVEMRAFVAPAEAAKIIGALKE